MRARSGRPARQIRKLRRNTPPQDPSLSFLLKVSPTPPTGPADRRCAHIILISGGTGSFEAGRQTREVSMGHVVIVSPGYSVRFFRTENLQMRVVRLDVAAFRMVARHWDIARAVNFKTLFPFVAPGAPQRGADPVLDFCLVSQIFEQLLALAGEIEREMAEQHPGWRDLASLHFHHLCIAASRGYAQQRHTSLDTDRRVAKALGFIERNFRDEITADTLAHAAAMSKRNFYRLFRQAVGLTPNTHLKQVRLTRASELLRLSEATITEICYDCGFTDSNFFSREFRRTHGMSPTIYRRIWRR